MHGTNSHYADHLSDADLAVLAPSVGVPPAEASTRLRARPELVESAISDPATFERVFGEPDELFVHASPFLVFAVAVHRTLRALEEATFVEERVGARLRVPVFDVETLRDLGRERERRHFLVDLLASYTTVASGPVWTRQGRRWRRQRFSELDPARLAAVAEAVPVAERAGVHRRLGDLALFLTGVFPDYTSRHGVGPVDLERLLRSVREIAVPEPSDIDRLTASEAAVLGWLGPHWYHLAALGTPLPPLRRLLDDVATRFDAARRFLNVVTDRVLFPLRGRLFPLPDA